MLKIISIAILVTIGLLIVIFFLLTLWRKLKDVSDVIADIRHGKGIFLTFNYTPEEWEYYTQSLPLASKSGKVCFTHRHIYISDGTEEILYEIFGVNPISTRLREISLNTNFIVFNVRNKELLTTESGKVLPDSPDNVKQYQILIPNSQQHQTDELINFYQRMIDKNNKEQAKWMTP